MKPAPTVRCPVCGRSFDPESSRTMPFCGPRCREIDLGRWLDERYGVPHESEQDPEAEDSYVENPDDQA